VTNAVTCKASKSDRKGKRLRISTTRRALSTCFYAAIALAALVPSPARADTLVCQTLVESTPGVRADVDGDGNPDVVVPVLSDVTLCAEAEVSTVTHPVTTDSCFIGWHPTCIAVYIRLIPPDVDGGVELCATIEGQGRTCRVVDLAKLGRPFAERIVCVGFDLHGNHPCSGSEVALTIQ
jgi:hypothetical protein